MPNIVVDSSIVIKWFVTEPLSAQARQVLEGYRSGTLTLLAPDLLAAEIGNIVWKKVRSQGLARADAQQILNAFRELEIELTPTITLLEDALQIAMTHERSVYDSLYIALSEREHCVFITADERLVNAELKPREKRMTIKRGCGIQQRSADNTRVSVYPLSYPLADVFAARTIERQ